MRHIAGLMLIWSGLTLYVLVFFVRIFDEDAILNKMRQRGIIGIQERIQAQKIIAKWKYRIQWVVILNLLTSIVSIGMLLSTVL